MALGTLLGTIASGVATAGAGALGSKLFGGGSSSSRGAPIAPVSLGINAGGLSGSNGTLVANDNRMGLVGGLQGGFNANADALAGLRARLTPGFSDLRNSRLAEVENARMAAVGNLRDNMARRRVLGSSFGQDALVRAESEFGKEKDRVAAESFLQEVEGTTNLINQEYELRRGAFETGLNELNLQADLAAKLAAGATAQLGASSRLEAELRLKEMELNAKESAGAGKFFGQTFQPTANEIGKGVTNFFTPAKAA